MTGEMLENAFHSNIESLRMMTIIISKTNKIMILVLKNQHNYDINFGDVQDSTFFACEKEISENDVTESEKEALAFTT